MPRPRARLVQLLASINPTVAGEHYAEICHEAAALLAGEMADMATFVVADAGGHVLADRRFLGFIHVQQDADGKPLTLAMPHGIVDRPVSAPTPPTAPRWRHVKRGTTYVEVARGVEVQAAHGVAEGDRLVVYAGEDGRTWARPEAEFDDGRFAPADPSSRPRQGEGQAAAGGQANGESPADDTDYAAIGRAFLDRFDHLIASEPMLAGYTPAEDPLELLGDLVEMVHDARGAITASPYQSRVDAWMQACFGAAIAADTTERNHRFLEEALELVQSLGGTASEAHQLVDYVFGRPAGAPHQEVGGVMVTLAALCTAAGLDGHAAAEDELDRVWTKIDQIRAKQAAKPKHSPLPQHVEAAADEPTRLAAIQANIAHVIDLHEQPSPLDRAVDVNRRMVRAYMILHGIGEPGPIPDLSDISLAEALAADRMVGEENVRRAAEPGDTVTIMTTIAADSLALTHARALLEAAKAAIHPSRTALRREAEAASKSASMWSPPADWSGNKAGPGR